MSAKVSLVRCQSYEPELVEQKVREAIDLLGGITAFIKPQSKVLVKPNLLMAKEPEAGITTHPEVVRQVIRLLKAIDCQVFLGDGPSVWGGQIENVDEVYEKTGMKKICEQERVSLVKFQKRRWKGKFPLDNFLDECDYLINLPKFKTHNLMLLTGAVKNLFGLVSGTYKTELHKDYFEVQDFAKILVDIYQEAKPALTLVDGIVAMEGDGPATCGKLRQMDLLLAGSDCVALDAVLAKIMGIKPFDVLSTKEAAGRNLGVADVGKIELLGDKLEDASNKPFLLPTTSAVNRMIPKTIITLAKSLIKYYPCVEQDNCIACATCIAACPVKAITMKDKRIRFDYKKCISCFCCQETCPQAAIKVKKSLLAKLLRL